MLVVDQPMIFVESSPVPLVAHPKKFIEIGILIVYSPFNSSEFWVSYTHCLMPYRNALRRAHGIGAVKPKLYRARGCLSVIPDNTVVRSICYIAAYIRNTNKHTIRKCDRERSGSIWRVSFSCIYPLSKIQK